MYVKQHLRTDLCIYVINALCMRLATALKGTTLDNMCINYHHICLCLYSSLLNHVQHSKRIALMLTKKREKNESFLRTLDCILMSTFPVMRVPGTPKVSGQYRTGR